MTEKTRYTDEELEEFKAIILEKLDKARKEIQTIDEYKYVVENDDVHLAKDKIAKIIKEHQK